jgi:hypothetical protein
LSVPRCSLLSARIPSFSLTRLLRMLRLLPHEHSKSVRCSERQSSSKPRSISRPPHPHPSTRRPEHSMLCSDSERCCMRSPILDTRLKPAGLKRDPAAEGGECRRYFNSTGPCPSVAPPLRKPPRGTVHPPLLFDNTAKYGAQDEAKLRSTTLNLWLSFQLNRLIYATQRVGWSRCHHPLCSRKMPLHGR